MEQPFHLDHELFMREALVHAKKAMAIDEVPIGCVIVHKGEIIGRGYNQRTAMKNALYHAEIIAINEACSRIGDWRLEECALYVTIEPCPMCAGAIIQARVKEVIFGARNRKAGCAGSILNILAEPSFNHQAVVTENILAEECAGLMSEYFANLRKAKSTSEFHIN
jgi:tRNA(adenine34) deaminase